MMLFGPASGISESLDHRDLFVVDHSFPSMIDFCRIKMDGMNHPINLSPFRPDDVHILNYCLFHNLDNEPASASSASIDFWYRNSCVRECCKGWKFSALRLQHLLSCYTAIDKTFLQSSIPVGPDIVS